MTTYYEPRIRFAVEAAPAVVNRYVICRLVRMCLAIVGSR